MLKSSVCPTIYLHLWEIHTASSKIWTRVNLIISHHDNRYTTSASEKWQIPFIAISSRSTPTRTFWTC